MGARYSVRDRVTVKVKLKARVRVMVRVMVRVKGRVVVISSWPRALQAVCTNGYQVQC